MISKKHWGELEDSEEFVEKKDAKPDKMRSTSFHNFELPPLYQPVCHQKSNKKESLKRSWMKGPLDSKGQSYLLHAIELQHYKRRMKYMLAAAQSHQAEVQRGNVPEVQMLPTPPQAPKRFCSNEGKLVSQTKPSFLGVEYSASSSKKRSNEYKHFHNPLVLDALAVRQLMMKAVAAICSHTGFENKRFPFTAANETTLQTLTDIAIEYCCKFCCKLKTYYDHQPKGETSIDGFVHVLQQVSCEGLDSLQDYWITRIKNVALKLEKEDKQLLDDYNALKDSTSQQVTIKEEKP
ncbi:STAGA complex 65 subunit gamma-like isoform X1 [Clytia hemisphaerica]|uniref:STAGA complex 65 subunit gamma-like isoform X1 n=1 Tax=Clytia hemisphaerica TaxID=252671 RepID=UPI0034D58093